MESSEITTLQAAMGSLSLRSKLKIISRIDEIGNSLKLKRIALEDSVISSIGTHLQDGNRDINLGNLSIDGTKLSGRIMRLIDQFAIEHAFVRGRNDDKEWFVVKGQGNRAADVVAKHYQGVKGLKYGSRGDFVQGFVDFKLL